MSSTTDTGRVAQAPPEPPATSRYGPHALRTAVATGRGVLARHRYVTMLLLAVVVLVLGLTGNAGFRYSLTLATAYGIVVLGNSATAAVLGEINLGGLAFMAVGAYTMANLLEHDVAALPALLVSGLAAAVVGLVLAIPTTQLRGISTALVTFALAYSISDLATYLTPVTNGDEGKFLPADLELAGLLVSGSNEGLLVLAVVVMVLACAGHIALLNSRPGRVAISVGEVERASAIFGTPIRPVQLAVWVWASFLGGLGGALYGLAVGFVSASQWQIMLSIFVFVGGLVGGTRSASGAWIGGMIVGGLPIWLQGVVPPTATTLVYGVILVLALLAGGRGLAELGERLGVTAWLRLRVRS
ncbi:branched-chain amino acid ABC transporter permease [Pseudonocardia sp. RS11V-5]|uniref:branched-chain amino acid ABC transporter permease n=1 Tax=Pseudonocardia terrae TaxID=2905831 RepID=UPI001E4C1002|nr:branched-chain amino acid ABC transporter permease [Pseudonocardia terrae]MCE3551116.1 branched-chain amino acid ABC transporter permease [Pseudonocardia terrae]